MHQGSIGYSLTHPGRVRRTQQPSVTEVGAEHNKVVALWDVVCQACMKHAFTAELMLSALQCKRWCERPIHNVYIDRTVLFSSMDRLSMSFW